MVSKVPGLITNHQRCMVAPYLFVLFVVLFVCVYVCVCVCAHKYLPVSERQVFCIWHACMQAWLYSVAVTILLLYMYLYMQGELFIMG